MEFIYIVGSFRVGGSERGMALLRAAALPYRGVRGSHFVSPENEKKENKERVRDLFNLFTKLLKDHFI